MKCGTPAAGGELTSFLNSKQNNLIAWLQQIVLPADDVDYTSRDEQSALVLVTHQFSSSLAHDVEQCQITSV